MLKAKRMPAAQVRDDLERIVEEVEVTGEPVIIHKRGRDRAVLVSVPDFEKLQLEEEDSRASEHARARAALREAGLLSEPTAKMRERAAEYDARYSPEEQERILARLRTLKLDPPLSQVILDSREWYPDPGETDEE